MSSLIPSITTDFLQRILKDYFKTDIKVLNFVIPNLLDVTHSFCSDLIKISVSYSSEKRNTRELSMFAKVQPEDQEAVAMLSHWNCFENEVDVYAHVLPAIHNLDKEIRVAADAIYVSSTPRPTIFLKDLTVLGFRNPNRIDLPLDHLLLTMEKLAFLHAASVAVYEKDPKMITKFNMAIHADHPITAHMLSSSIVTLKEVCEKTPELQKYVDKISYERIIPKLFSAVKPGKFNVLNHGDAWSNNFMFRYDQQGKVVDMLMVDFQFPVFGGPALDLQYIWVVCTSVKTKRTCTDQILAHYYRKLAKNLLKLKIKSSIPSMVELKEEFNSKAIHGFATILTTLSIFLGKKPPVFR
ncbi:hypothetical protein RI129_010675 [Pyrocoelia pectoralis]|uniref:CHK kinase-like domain-containing protein n=1 Tax=Pyrocoelia pectoralis TaxID=417401 RepID=A0AAN7V4M1_9COLE